ncbi:DgyrCDS734 [Dimorphilus gyrociliatus]|uniref:DgyrCDS734 n=1 Tax=Dimorphilus gyrociliatus TaxID=2664684 RepID=A0A7I8V6S8_9ANNE|nr:DgyrCDS734 [Dimorphilus gyrociliatus]
MIARMHLNVLTLLILSYLQLILGDNLTKLKCSSLRKGQYRCDEPLIDPERQAADNCNEETRTSRVWCYPVENILCDGKVHNGSTRGFQMTVPCKWTNGKRFDTALLFSIFLGMLGVDRFYLGYSAIGTII